MKTIIMHSTAQHSTAQHSTFRKLPLAFAVAGSLAGGVASAEPTYSLAPLHSSLQNENGLQGRVQWEWQDGVWVAVQAEQVGSAKNLTAAVTRKFFDHLALTAGASGSRLPADAVDKTYTGTVKGSQFSLWADGANAGLGYTAGDSEDLLANSTTMLHGQRWQRLEAHTQYNLGTNARVTAVLGRQQTHTIDGNHTDTTGGVGLEYFTPHAIWNTDYHQAGGTETIQAGVKWGLSKTFQGFGEAQHIQGANGLKDNRILVGVTYDPHQSYSRPAAGTLDPRAVNSAALGRTYLAPAELGRLVTVKKLLVDTPIDTTPLPTLNLGKIEMGDKQGLPTSFGPIFPATVDGKKVIPLTLTGFPEGLSYNPSINRIQGAYDALGDESYPIDGTYQLQGSPRTGQVNGMLQINNEG